MGLYVFCRKRDYQIPATLQCRGTNNPAHRDLWFRTCNNCGDFLWIPPPSPSEDPYAINPGQGPGANDPSPRNEAFRSPSPGLLAIDPALQDHPSALQSLALFRPPISQNAVARAETARGWRTRRTAPTPYASSAAKNVTVTAPMDHTVPRLPQTLQMEILPRCPARPPSSQLLQPRLHHSPSMRRKEAEDQKHLDVRRVQNEVCFCYFSEDGKEPEHLRDQDVPRHPYYNLSESAGMLRKMKLDREDEKHSELTQVQTGARRRNVERPAEQSGRSAVYEARSRLVGVSRHSQLAVYTHVSLALALALALVVRRSGKRPPNLNRTEPCHHYLALALALAFTLTSPSPSSPAPPPQSNMLLSAYCMIPIDVPNAAPFIPSVRPGTFATNDPNPTPARFLHSDNATGPAQRSGHITTVELSGSTYAGAGRARWMREQKSSVGPAMRSGAARRGAGKRAARRREAGMVQVPVIAIFTKFDGLINEAFTELLDEGLLLEAAKEGETERAKMMLINNFETPLMLTEFPPSDHAVHDSIQEREFSKTEVNIQRQLRAILRVILSDMIILGATRIHAEADSGLLSQYYIPGFATTIFAMMEHFVSDHGFAGDEDSLFREEIFDAVSFLQCSMVAAPGYLLSPQEAPGFNTADPMVYGVGARTKANQVEEMRANGMLVHQFGSGLSRYEPELGDSAHQFPVCNLEDMFVATRPNTPEKY
ncbi:hypothetical protein B0H11DRAFT_2241044 [Mycena galericulata]|nr:hypothetical protein B0H11DRAFT_2241044 [Mycena galericulata]